MTKAELREFFINVFPALLVQIAVVTIKLLFPSLDPDILSLVAAIVVAAVLLCLMVGRRPPDGYYHVKIAVVIVATVLVLFASFVVRDPSLKLSPSIPYEATVVKQCLVSVPADQYWFNTGIEVQRGDHVELKARGHWYSGISMTGPKGDRGIKALLGLRRCGQCPVVGGNLGELVGKVGGNFPFRVGSSAVGVATRDGSLWLTMNDSTGSCKGG
jgi:hypothetical protein